MATATGNSWKQLSFPVIVTCLSVWLAYGAIATGMAGHYEGRGDGERALGWRENSPLALGLTAESLVEVENYDAADALARRALKRSSLEAGALRALALSALAKGQTNDALTMMSRAGRLNPRDDQTQGWLFERAMARGDYRRAVLHADALMRRSPQAQALISFELVPLLGNGDARTTLVDRLSGDPPWRGEFLSAAARRGHDADVAALFLALKRTASPPTDAETATFFDRLVTAGRYRQAKDYFDALVGAPSGASTLVYDGGFAGRPGPAPLNWYAIPVLGGSARWTMADGTPLGNLLVTHDGFSSSGPILRQLILLSPGSYEVVVRTKIANSSAAGRFSLQIACTVGSRLASMSLQGAPRSWETSKAGFVVPPEACGAQWLAIYPVTGDRREVVEMWIDDVVVRPAMIGSLSPKELQ